MRMLAAAAGVNSLQSLCAAPIDCLVGTRTSPPRALIPERPEQYPGTALHDGAQPVGDKNRHEALDWQQKCEGSRREKHCSNEIIVQDCPSFVFVNFSIPRRPGHKMSHHMYQKSFAVGAEHAEFRGRRRQTRRMGSYFSNLDWHQSRLRSPFILRFSP